MIFQRLIGEALEGLAARGERGVPALVNRDLLEDRGRERVLLFSGEA